MNRLGDVLPQLVIRRNPAVEANIWRHGTPATSRSKFGAWADACKISRAGCVELRQPRFIIHKKASSKVAYVIRREPINPASQLLVQLRERSAADVASLESFRGAIEQWRGQSDTLSAGAIAIYNKSMVKGLELDKIWSSRAIRFSADFAQIGALVGKLSKLSLLHVADAMLRERSPEQFPSWLEPLYEGPTARLSSRAMMLLFDGIYSYHENHGVSALDQIVKDLNLSVMSSVAMTAFLRYTFAFRSSLPSWPILLERVQDELISRNLDAGRLTRGLNAS
jgi:hypothetical protein